jgi:ankyrin repeat protein
MGDSMIEPISAVCIAALTKISLSAMEQFAPGALTGTVVGGLIGNRADGIMCKLVGGAARNFVKNIRQPENHDLFKGMLAAHGRAFAYYAQTLQTQVQTPQDRIVADKIAELARRKLPENTDTSEALMGIVTPLISGEGDVELETRRERLVGDAVGRLKSWIETETKEQLPAHFLACLTETAPNRRPSWAAMFQLHLSEAIKTEPRYERIFLASNVAELLGRTISIQQVAETMLQALERVHGKLDDLKAAAERIEQKQDDHTQKLDRLLVLLTQWMAQQPFALPERQIQILAQELDQAGAGSLPVGDMVRYLPELLPSAQDAVPGGGAAEDDGRGFRQAMFDWLDRYIAPAVRARANPYKELAYFDVSDGADFHGRGEEVTQAGAIVADILAGTCLPRALCVGGISGTGKSSFLRAGVLGRLVAREDVAIVILRPEDLVPDIGIPSGVLGAVAEQSDLMIPAKAMARCATTPAPQAAQLVSEAIAHAAAAAGKKLVFAFDQLEEIVDYWASDGAAHASERRFWAPLFDIMGKIAAEGQGCVLYTLESNRKALIAKCSASPIFDLGQVARIELTQPRMSFFSEIIRAPFEAKNYHLSPAVVRALLDEVEALEHHGGDAPGRAVLPLLSLKLAKLFDFVDQRFAPVPLDRLNRGWPELPDSGFITPDDLASGGEAFDFAIGNEIDLLASAAWRSVHGEGDPDPYDLDFFLPFVGATDGADLLQLRQVAEGTVAERRSTLDALRKARLIEESQGRYRLIHEAVLRGWKPAREWLDWRLPILRTESRLRGAAKLWAQGGRPVLREADKALIVDAADLLISYLWAWYAPKVPLEDEDALLRDYCLAVFALVDDTIVLNDDRTSLSLAAGYGQAELVKRLLAARPDSVSLPSGPKRRTPLLYAAWNYPEVVEILLAAGADAGAVEAEGFPVISAAIWGGQDRVFRLLLAASGGKLPTPPGGSLLHDCASAGRLEMCKYLIETGIGDPKAPNGLGELPIHSAAYFGRREVFAFLAALSDPFAAAAGGENCWHYACMQGHLGILEEMSDLPGFAGHESDTMGDGHNGLHIAASYHRTAIVEWLFRFPDLNRPVESARPASRLTPLMLAVERQGAVPASYQAEIAHTVRALLADPATDLNAYAANPSEAGKERTALSMASELPLVQSELLSDERLDLIAQRPGVPNPLEIAAQRGWWNALRGMLRRIDADDAADVERNPLGYLAGLRSILPDDIFELCAQKWPPTAATATALLGIAVAARNEKLGAYLLQRAGTLRDEHRKVLWSAVSYRMSLEFVDALASHIPGAWSLPYWGGYTVLHRLCASQAVILFELYKDSIAKDPAAWEARDLAGRKPADLLAPERRAALEGVARSDHAWPARGSWDNSLNWRPASAEERRACRPLREQAGYADDACEVSAAHPSFYPETVTLLRAARTGAAAGEERLYCLLLEGRPFPLTGQSLPIHLVNEDDRLVLPPDDHGRVADYVRFFCFFVRGEDGPFLVFEDVDQSGFPPNLPEDEAELLRGITSFPWAAYDPEEDTFYVMTNMIYGMAGFTCDLEVKPTGLVHMNGDAPLTHDLSSRPDVPLADYVPTVA